MRADNGRVLKKKKTTFQKFTGSNGEQPIFNETLVFDMPPNELIQTVVLALVCFGDKPRGPKQYRSDAAYSVSLHQQHQTSVQSHDDSLFHFSGNLNHGASVFGGHGKSQRGSQEPGRSNNELNSAQNCSTGNGVDISEQGRSNSTAASSAESFPKKGRKEKDVVVGKVAFGCCVKNPIGRFHWEKMVLSPRTVVNEWHYLK